MDDQDRQERLEALRRIPARFERLVGPGVTVPLDEIAGMLPTLPDWREFERRGIRDRQRNSRAKR